MQPCKHVLKLNLNHINNEKFNCNQIIVIAAYNSFIHLIIKNIYMHVKNFTKTKLKENKYLRKKATFAFILNNF